MDGNNTSWIINNDDNNNNLHYFWKDLSFNLKKEHVLKHKIKVKWTSTRYEQSTIIFEKSHRTFQSLAISSLIDELSSHQKTIHKYR